MDYEKAYKEAIKRAKAMIEVAEKEEVYKSAITIFPELKESEDERIRNVIRGWIYTQPTSFFDNGISKEEMLAWLEKQGEQKVPGNDFKAKDWYVSKVDGKIHNIYNAGVEPKFHKFHEGDWVVCEVTGSVYQIKNCIENLSNHKYGYDLTNGGYIGSDEVNHYHLWTIQDARDGDVLVASDGSLFIFAKVKDNSAYYYFSLCKNGSKEISDGNHAWETANSCHPATKEQSDFLFQEIRKAGYKWDAEKKEVKKLEKQGN